MDGFLAAASARGTCALRGRGRGPWGRAFEHGLSCPQPHIPPPAPSSLAHGSHQRPPVLRNMGRDRHLVIAGAVTDQCVAHAAKDAADLGYRVTLVTGASLLVAAGCL